MSETPDVQLKNGYTAIANEIFDHMAGTKLSPTQYRIIFVVWRYTYGFKRKCHDMSLTFLSSAIKCDKRQLQRELKDLEERKIIFQKITNGKTRQIGFNKHYDQWTGETTIGETTIGETTIGETVKGTIGETVKGTIGETVKGTIGETTNQEINNINKNIKKDIKSISADKKTSSAYAETIAIFYEHYQNTYHVKYMFNNDRDGSATKRLIAQYDLETIKELIGLYFELEDKYIDENGRSISAFASTIVINKCLALKKKKEEYESAAGKDTGLGIRF